MVINGFVQRQLKSLKICRSNVHSWETCCKVCDELGLHHAHEGMGWRRVSGESQDSLIRALDL